MGIQASLCLRVGRTSLLASLATFFLAWPSQGAVITFQEGDGGLYSETNATWIEERNPTSNKDATETIQLELEYRTTTNLIFRGVVGFFDIIGEGVGRIPAGSTINSATLQLTPTTATNSGGGAALVNVHTMLTPWSETSVAWGAFGESGLSDKGNAGGGAPGVDYVAEPLDSQPALDGLGTAPPDPSLFNVTSAVQAWADGFANYGWMLTFESTNGVFYYADNVGTQTWRPLLTVDFAGGVGIVPGDVNGDGTVDEADYFIIRDNMFETVDLRGDGDLVRDGIVDFADFREWKNNASSAALAAIEGFPIPEPSTLVGVVVLVLTGLRRTPRIRG